MVTSGPLQVTNGIAAPGLSSRAENLESLPNKPWRRMATRYDKLFTGLVVERPKLLPEGGSPAFSQEDTWDSDYGGLLELAHGMSFLRQR